MRSLATSLLIAALLSCLAIPAQTARKYPPGPPYRTCPDTLRLFDVQQSDTLLAPCHPAVLDTVLGVGGIITGFDAKPAAYATYFQNSRGGAFSGMMAFTGAFNYNASPFNLALGDSIVVYGTTQESPNPNGTTEIEGPDVLQNTNDIIIRKVSSGNPLPPFQIVTTKQLNWIPSSTGNQGETWEGCLVRLRGPLRVGRTSTQNGLPTLPLNTFLVVSSTSLDSVLIDGNTLTTLTPPPVFAIVDSVQGIVNQNTTSGTNSYRVQLRSMNDLFRPVPPNLTDAYPIDDTITGSLTAPRLPQSSAASNERLRIVFDRGVDVATAETEANYSLSLVASTVNLATVEGGSGNIVLLDITSAEGRGAPETVTVTGVGAASCPPCVISPAQSRSFYNAVLTAKEVQSPAPESLTVCIDRSRFAGVGSGGGARISVRGVGVGQLGTTQFLEDPDVALRSGINVFAPTGPLQLGHQYVIAGQIQEFGGDTQIANNVYLVDQGTVGAPAPVEFSDTQLSRVTNSSCDASQSVVNGEDYEAMLIRINRLMVTERRTLGQSFLAGSLTGTTPLDTILVMNLNGTLNTVTPPDSGTVIDVTGLLHFTNGTFRICPRSAGDIILHTTGVAGSDPAGTVSFSAYPNPARTLRIDFSLPRRDYVELGVFDVLGRRVALLARGLMPAGAYARQWDGRDGGGRSAGPGVYFLRLKVGQETFRLRNVKLD